jgi:metal-dependent hydrolase (beta-lactamase superfamily II)
MRFDRRSFLCAGGASIFSAISRRPANAQSSEIGVPCVEWLAIRIVAVAYRQPIQNSIGPIKQFQSAESTVFPPSVLLSPSFQRDATIHVQSASGSDMRSFLIDPCSDPRVLLERMDRLRINLSSLDALVLSGDNQREHEALHDFLRAANGCLKKDIEVVMSPHGLTKTSSSFGLDPSERASVVEVGQSRIVAGQSLVVGSRQSAPSLLRSDDISLIDYQLEPQGMADPTQISASFVLVEKGLVIITSSNEGAASCVRAAQEASEVSDVHAIVGMNIGVGASPAKAQTILSELLEFNPAHIVVSADIGSVGCNLVEAKSSKKIVSCSTETRIVFRV